MEDVSQGKDFRSVTVSGRSPAQLHEKEPHETELKCLKGKKSTKQAYSLAEDTMMHIMKLTF